MSGFSTELREELSELKTLSIENLELNLMRYGSVTSLVETDIDSGETTEYQVFLYDEKESLRGVLYKLHVLPLLETLDFLYQSGMFNFCRDL
jgi:hypothetical protein